MKNSYKEHFRKTLPALILTTTALLLTAATNIQGAVTPAIVPKLLTTFTNPTPTTGEYFGRSLAAVGASRVLIGASLSSPWDAGAAYLLSANGSLLTTVTNPAGTAGDVFGWSVAAVGSDRVLIGAFGDSTVANDGGAAFLFNTSGALLTRFINPTPAAADVFGYNVAAVGSDRVIISAPSDDTGVVLNSGAAYLFSTNGTLLTTFTNPTPAYEDRFGNPLAALGNDRVLIGAYQDGPRYTGAVYLFSTDGTLLTTITNPKPAISHRFGYSVAAVGTDRVLIGEIYNNTGANSAGAAYLFDTNGALLTTFTNPTPAIYDTFGASVAAVGADRMLIGAPGDDTGANDAGAAYLFSTNGTLLTTFNNPTPAVGEGFSISVAAVGTNQVLIGAAYDNSSATMGGAAYLFSLEPPARPSLSTSRNPSLSTLTISWPAPAEGWLLESTNALPSMAASAWPPVPPPYQTNAGTISVTLTNQPATGNQFFRLRQP